MLSMKGKILQYKKELQYHTHFHVTELETLEILNISNFVELEICKPIKI